ncbi:MAG: ABC transporter permease [Chloroflexota bacterium]
MLTYAVRRIAAALPVLLLVATISFVIVRLIPGDPATLMLGPGATRDQIAALREQLGLDRPLIVQYLEYVYGLARGDLGNSAKTRRPVTEEIAQRLPATVELAVAATLVAVPLGVAFGTLTALRRNSVWDHLGRIIALLGVSVPVFWLALAAQLVLALWLDLLPVSGRISAESGAVGGTGFVVVGALLHGDLGRLADAVSHLVVPSLVLGAFLTATVSRMARAALLDVLADDYIRTARAKGLSAVRVIGGHALRNALLPVLTITGLKFAELLSGAVLTETIFAWPGLGRYMYEAITGRDYAVVQGTTVLFATVYVLVLLAVDLSYGLLDPRVRR